MHYSLYLPRTVSVLICILYCMVPLSLFVIIIVYIDVLSDFCFTFFQGIARSFPLWSSIYAVVYTWNTETKNIFFLNVIHRINPLSFSTGWAVPAGTAESWFFNLIHFILQVNMFMSNQLWTLNEVLFQAFTAFESEVPRLTKVGIFSSNTVIKSEMGNIGFMCCRTDTTCMGLFKLNLVEIACYPMFVADSRFWLVTIHIGCTIISFLTQPA